jgi:hypothetical protein
MKGKFDFLFRPGLHGTLSTLDIFFQNNPKLLALFSLGFHLGVCFILFLIFSQFLKGYWPLLLAGTFAVQGPGMEMILWHHVSPYILSSFFFLLGCYFFFFSKLKLSALFTFFSFFAACLFHEMTALALVPIFILSLLLKYKSFKKLSIELLLPSLLFLTLNGIDLNSTQTLQNFASSSEFSNFSTLNGFLIFVGISFTLFLCPFLFIPSLGDPGVQKMSLDYSENSFFVFALIGCFVMVGLFFAMSHYFKKVKDKKNPLLVLCLFILTYLAVLLVGYSKGRLGMLGPRYILVSTYYFYFTTLAFFILLSVAFYWWDKKNPILQNALKVFCALFCLGSLFRIYERVGLDFNQKKTISELNSKISSFLEKNPQYCYGGTSLHSFDTFALSSILFRQSCALSNKKRMLLTTDQTGVAWTLELPETTGKSVSFKKALIPSPSENIFEGHLLSEKKFKPNHLHFKVQKAGIGAVLFGYKDPDNFNMILFGPEKISALAVVDKKPMPLTAEITLGNPDPFEIELFKMGNLILLLKDKVVIGKLPEKISLDGKVGLYAWGGAWIYRL